MKVLSKIEMKKIMGGGFEQDPFGLDDSGGGPCDGKSAGDVCTLTKPPCKDAKGKCNTSGVCVGGC